jgi:hypothetical protein
MARHRDRALAPDVGSAVGEARRHPGQVPAAAALARLSQNCAGGAMQLL